MRTRKSPGTPTASQIEKALKDIAWEYAAMVAAALEIAKGPEAPTNHLVQEAFLVHVRNLAEFFRLGVKEFKKTPAVLVPRSDDNVYAVDLCHSVLWSEAPFDGSTRLIKAINKTLSHITYSRDLTSGVSEIDSVFDGYLHVHGTVNLIRRTWEKFLQSVRPEYVRPLCPMDIQYWLDEHTKKWSVQFSDLGNEFERRAKGWSHWKLNETPDGTI
jgi:hypothetical protein